MNRQGDTPWLSAVNPKNIPLYHKIHMRGGACGGSTDRSSPPGWRQAALMSDTSSVPTKPVIEKFPAESLSSEICDLIRLLIIINSCGEFVFRPTRWTAIAAGAVSDTISSVGHGSGNFSRTHLRSDPQQKNVCLQINTTSHNARYVKLIIREQGDCQQFN